MLNVEIDIRGTEIAGGAGDGADRFVEKLRAETLVDVAAIVHAAIGIAQARRDRRHVAGMGFVGAQVGKAAGVIGVADLAGRDG